MKDYLPPMKGDQGDFSTAELDGYNDYYIS